MKIFLVGLPGSGKSTIAKRLSEILEFRLIDTDEEICQKEKSSIEDIFKYKGEDYFRECERKILNEIVSEDHLIVSTGGGLPCFFNNMKIINENGISIFLNVPPPVIADRLWVHENQNRPLIQGKTKEQLLEFLVLKLKERLAFYRQSKIELEGSEINAKEIVNRLRGENLI